MAANGSSPEFNPIRKGRSRNDETVYFPVRCLGELGDSVSNIKKGTKLFVVISIIDTDYVPSSYNDNSRQL